MCFVIAIHTIVIDHS